jgi:uncharacterized protein (TIGR02145 family)
MPIQLTSSNYNGRAANITLYSSTGNTIPYTSATTISLGVQTFPFTYSSSTISDEYGHFSCNFTDYSKTCIVNKQTPPDGDGNVYDTIKIGNQIWMSENLKTTKFQDGTPLSNTSEVDNATWAAASGSTTKYWALVNGTSANTQTYGLVYNQFAVTGSTTGATASNNLCPSGWHVPTSAEFTTLNTFLGTATAGTQMKSTTLWASAGNGTNSSGFNGVPSGRRPSSWQLFNTYNFFWTTSVSTNSVFWTLRNTSNLFELEGNLPSLGNTVRCLKN